MKKTIVFGASTNPSRYANLAVHRLIGKGHEVVPIGIRAGSIADIPIQVGQPVVEDVHTISLYLNPERQRQYYDYLLSLNPQRIIFNPGTENPELIRLAREKGIETELACTLVMLAAQTY